MERKLSAENRYIPINQGFIKKNVLVMELEGMFMLSPPSSKGYFNKK